MVKILESIFVLIVIATLVSGCVHTFKEPSEVTLDGNDLYNSKMKATRHLPAARVMEFIQACNALEHRARIENRSLYDVFHGKTVSQIIAAGAESEQQRIERVRHNIRTQIDALEDKRAQSLKDRATFKEFKVLGARYYNDHSRFRPHANRIDVDLYNGTTETISGVRLDISIREPGRAVPWSQRAYKTNIGGGIEPGERGTLSFDTETWLFWNNPKNVKGLAAVVHVQEIYGLSGAPVFTGKQFDHVTEKLMEQLKERYRKLGGNDNE